MFAAPARASSELLNSWKEIAAYLNRGIRTVQRWEAELGMPTRRPSGKGRTAVIALRSELDAWLKSRPGPKSQPAPGVARRSNKELLLASQDLRARVSEARHEHRVAMVEFTARLEKMALNLKARSQGLQDGGGGAC